MKMNKTKHLKVSIWLECVNFLMIDKTTLISHNETNKRHRPVIIDLSNTRSQDSDIGSEVFASEHHIAQKPDNSKI